MKKLFTLILVFVAALFFVACGHTHEFGEWVVVKEATEVEEGLKERTCECGEKESQTIDKLAHTHAFGEWVVVKEATETEEGSKERVCACGEKETETIEKLAHTHAFGEWVVVKEATETEEGLKERECACGEKETEVIAKLEHVHAFGEWVVVKEPTFEEEGSKERTCSCGEKEIDVLPKLVKQEKTIAEIVAAEDGEFEVEAVVVAVNAQSFLIKDETGAMLVYKGKEWVQDVVVGDKVKVAGLTSVYGNAKQFGQDATYEKLETVEVVYEEAKALTAADVDAYAKLEKITPEYVTFSGKLSVSGGKYFNVAIEGATVIGSLTYPVDAEGLKALHGKEIVATGYVTGYVSNKYMNVIFTEVKEFTYTVSFKNVELEPVVVAKGGKLAKPADPVKEGATFVGWFVDELLTTPYDFEAVVASDLVLYAKFDGIKYSITYNLSGGKCDDLVNEFTNGAEVTLPIPTKEGNTFLGWFENGVKVEKLENKNYDLVARWETAKYTITYDLDGGTCYDLITEFKHDEDITLPTPSKDGFIFEGWFEGETKVEEITNKNYELKAKWRQFVPCTVNYDLDGGMFTYGYQTSAEIGDAFFNDFVKYSNGTYANESEVKEPTKSLFQNQSHPSVKTSLANAEMLAKWNWLWKYMLVHLKEYNATQTSAYITDTYPVLEKMINGDTNAINENANARTSIRSYLHGLINSMKGCGDSNPTFAVYSPDFSDPDVQKGILINQYDTTVELEKGAELPVPVKDGYAFTGWYDANGNKVTTVSGDMSVKAKWEETIVVTSIAISNKIDSLELLKTYQLKWDITPADAINKLVKFSSSNEKVVTVSPEGLITAVGKGQATVTILSLSSSAKSDTFVINVVAPGYFDISYETNSYVGLGEEIKINAEYINGDKKEALTWTSLNSDIATVDANGKVTGVKAGTAAIRVALTSNPNVYQEFVIAVLADDISDALQFVLDAHESNVFVKYELPIGAGTPNYYKDIFGSVSDFLYNEELIIDTTYNKATNEKYGDTLESRRMKSIEFVTVHYTAGFNPTAGGAAHGSYFAQPLSSNNTSIHYSTGNDGIFKGLDEQYRAAHAGDDGSFNSVPNGFEWIDTAVEVLESDPKYPVVTITSNATFAINGRDTGVKVPNETKFNRGYVTDSKWLNDQGIAVNVKDGKYQVGTTWWCYTQIAEGRICSNGGNANSIGIESAVNKGSDLWYTWQKTAKLVADILVRHNLDVTKVKGHHFFSAKDCPQPMLENDMEIWWKFIEMVEAEYEKATALKDITFEFDCESDLVDEHGRVVKQNLFSEVVTYKATIVTEDDIEEITLSSIVEGTYAK